MRPGLPSFLLTTQGGRKPDPLALMAQLRRHDGVILRHYDDPQRKRLAEQAALLCRAHGLRLLVAADWRLADRVNAAGVHLPEGILRSGRLAPVLGWARRRKRLVTAACHDRLALGIACRLGITAALVSPVLATHSHPDARPLGLMRFARLCRATPLPLFGLGGMRHDIRRRTGAAGMAGTIPLKPKRQAGTNRT